MAKLKAFDQARQKKKKEHTLDENLT